MNHTKKKNITYCVLAAELIVLLIAIIAGVTKEKTVYRFGGDTGEAVPCEGNEIELPRGSYEIVFTYDAQGEDTTIEAYADTSYGRVYGDTIPLKYEQNEKTFEHYQYETTDCFGFVLGQSQDVETQIGSMTISRNGKMDRAFCAMLIFIFLTADILLYLVQKKKIWENFSQEQKNVCIGLLFLFVFSLVPLFTNYITIGHDTRPHVIRIEGIAEALRMGQFPVRMQPGWVNDYGYPISVMYGDLLLYIPAVLRLIGFSLMNSYKIYIGLISFGTVLVSYHCFKNIAGNRSMGLLGSFLYTLSFYRILNVYARSAAGEYTAMMFLPLIFLGIYRILHTEGKEKNRYALLLVISYTAILQSHTLSFEMAILFSVLYCLCFGKRFWKNILYFVKAAAVTIVLNLSFLVPFVDYMTSHAMSWSETEVPKIQEYGVFVAQLFQTFFFGGFLSQSLTDGTNNEMPLSVGLALMGVLILFAWQYLAYRKQLSGQKEEWNGQCRMAVLMLLSILMACWFFPWKWLANIPAIGKYLVPYQYPWRFFTYATVFGVFLALYMLRNMEILNQHVLRKVTIGALCVVTVVHALVLYDRMLALYSAESISSGAYYDSVLATAGGEFLLEDANRYDTYDKGLRAEEGISIVDSERNHYRISVELENTAGDDRLLVLPLYAYKGFVVKDTQTGKRMETEAEEETQKLTVTIPAGYSGTVKADFKEPWYWRVSELVSLAMAVLIVLWYDKTYRREGRQIVPKQVKKEKK